MGRTAGEHVVENPTSEQGAVVQTSTGTIRERPNRTPKDAFYISEAKRKEYGIKDHETAYWARDPQVWSKIEFNDRVAELEADVEDGGMNARLIRTKEMDTVHIGAGGDLVLMAYPTELKEQMQAEIDEANRRYEAPFRRTEEGYECDEEIGLDRSNLKARMRAEHEFNRASGLAGGSSPTAGMSFMEASAYMKRIGFDVEAHQEMLRMGGHHTQQSEDQFQQMMTGMPKAKSFGIGKTGLGKTTAQKVAERAGRR